MDKTAAAAEINAVTVNLPTFWREQPELWFAQAEGQFRLRGITDENAKFDHVITSLDAITVANVSNLMRNRPTTTPYTRLRQRLAHIYELSDRERASRLLDIGHLGDQKPSELANKMLNMLEDRDANFLIRELFLRALPREVHAIVESSTSEFRELAHEADQHFTSSGRMVGNVTETAVSPATETLPEIPAAFNNRRLNNRPPNAGRTIHQGTKHRPSDQQTDSDLCFYQVRRRGTEMHSTLHVSHFPTSLRTAKYAFVRHDSHRKLLQRPYKGPFRVIERGNKTF